MPGMITSVGLGEKTLKMFVDEEEMEKFRVRQRNSNEPGCDDEEEQGQP